MEHDGTPDGDLYAEVQRSLEAGDLARAHALLRPLLRKEPPPIRGLTLLGHIHEEQGRPELAQYVYTGLARERGEPKLLEDFNRRAEGKRTTLEKGRKDFHVCLLLLILVVLLVEFGPRQFGGAGLFSILQPFITAFHNPLQWMSWQHIPMVLGGLVLLVYLAWRTVSSYVRASQLEQWRARLDSGFPDPLAPSAGCPACGMKTPHWLCVHCGTRVPEERWREAEQLAGVESGKGTSRATPPPGNTSSFLASAWRAARAALVDPEDGPAREMERHAPPVRLLIGTVLCVATAAVLYTATAMLVRMAAGSLGAGPPVRIAAHFWPLLQHTVPMVMLALGIGLAGMAGRHAAPFSSGFFLAGCVVTPFCAPIAVLFATRGNMPGLTAIFFLAALIVFLVALYSGMRREFGFTPMQSWLACLAVLVFAAIGTQIFSEASQAWGRRPATFPPLSFPGRF